MLTITFVNDGSGDRETGHYDVAISINGRVIAKERVEGHKRADGWRALVARLGRQEHDND